MDNIGIGSAADSKLDGIRVFVAVFSYMPCVSQDTRLRAKVSHIFLPASAFFASRSRTNFSVRTYLCWKLTVPCLMRKALTLPSPLNHCTTKLAMIGL